MIAFLIVAGWIFAIWGITVFLMQVVRKQASHAINIVWMSAGIVFLIWRIFGNVF